MPKRAAVSAGHRLRPLDSINAPSFIAPLAGWRVCVMVIGLKDAGAGEDLIGLAEFVANGRGAVSAWGVRVLCHRRYIVGQVRGLRVAVAQGRAVSDTAGAVDRAAAASRPRLGRG